MQPTKPTYSRLRRTHKPQKRAGSPYLGQNGPTKLREELGARYYNRRLSDSRSTNARTLPSGCRVRKMVALGITGGGTGTCKGLKVRVHCSLSSFSLVVSFRKCFPSDEGCLWTKLILGLQQLGQRGWAFKCKRSTLGRWCACKQPKSDFEITKA